MNLTVKVFKYTGDHRRANKGIEWSTTPLATINVNTSDDTSIIYPELLIDYAATNIDFNYAVIHEFNDRKYFVTPELSTGHRMLLHCTFDPYSNYDLSDVEGFIARNANASGRQNDKSVPVVYGEQLVHSYAFPLSPFKWSTQQPSNNTKDNFYILRTR